MIFESQQKQRGMTLIEVMVAMAIGLMLTLAISSVFLSQRQSYRENESTARMQENARFALELIVQDLRHAGFFGDIGSPSDIDVPTAISGATGNGCAGGIYEFTSAQDLISYANQITDTAGTDLADCVANTDFDAAGGNDTSILVVKRSGSTPTADADLVADRIYTHANGTNAQLFTTTDPTTLASGQNWAYEPRVYYIDKTKTLYRKHLTDAVGTLTAEPLAEGIEAMHLEFGIDSDNNGTPDYFYSPAAGTISDSAINSAVSATVYILARSPKEDHNYTDEKSYTLGNEVINGGNAFGDHYHRRVYSTTTALKNIRAQVMLNQGI